jgi:hypothetical protein
VPPCAAPATLTKETHTPEDIVAKLRQVEVPAAQGKAVAEAVRSIGVTEQTYRDELLDGEVFHTVREAQVLIEQWRRHFNTIRPHSALGYRPPAPEVVMCIRACESLSIVPIWSG